MAQSVAGKTAIVTGAGSGICLAFARLLLSRGANVVFCDLALRSEAKAVLASFQSQAVFQRTNVTSWNELGETFRVAQQRFGRIDIVCPGAGVFEPPTSSFWHPPNKTPSEDSQQGSRYLNLDVNLVHPIRMTQMAIAYFLADDPPVSRANPKSVIITASIASESASLHFPLYHAAKHGIFGFIKSLATLEKHLGIRVTGVLPGTVKTPIWTDAPEKMKMLDHLDEDNPNVWMTPEYIAEVMLALVENDDTSSMIALGATYHRIEGGTCLEILPGSVRDVPLLNNPGPPSMGKEAEEAFDRGSEIERELLKDLRRPGWGKFS